MINWLRSLRAMKFWQIVLALLVMAGSGSGVYLVSNSTTQPQESTTTVTQQVAVTYGDLSQTLTVSGSLAYYTTQQLSFGAAGTISEVKVAAGDSVAEGDILATFDEASNRALQKTLLQAKIALGEAEDNLEEARSPYSDADIAQAQSAVISAQMALDTAEENLSEAQDPYSEADLAQARLNVINARIALGEAEDNLEEAQDPYSEADLAQARLNVINAQIALETAEENLDKAEYPYTDEEIQEAEDAVDTAEQELEATYYKVQSDVATAEAEVADTYEAYEDARLHGTQAEQQQAYKEWQAAEANLLSVQISGAKSISAAKKALEEAQDTLAEMLADPDPRI